MQNDYNNTATFIEIAIRELGGFDCPSRTKVLDFGCGMGHLVGALLLLDFDAYGCDIKGYESKDQTVPMERLSTISLNPYTLPFKENTFDVVVSTSVLEHAQNKRGCFQEIHRVIRSGGFSMHLYPGKWYLPYEPHIYVPLANYFWPKCPKWWFGIWALLGVRNKFQRNKNWKEVLKLNQKYYQNKLSYWSSSQYYKLSLDIFGNCFWPMQFYIKNSHGGYARIFRRLPFTKFFGLLSRELRMGFMVQQKAG